MPAREGNYPPGAGRTFAKVGKHNSDVLALLKRRESSTAGALGAMEGSWKEPTGPMKALERTLVESG